MNLLNSQRFVCLWTPWLQVSLWKQTGVSFKQDLHISLNILLFCGFVCQSDQKHKPKTSAKAWKLEEEGQHCWCCWLVKISAHGPCTAVQGQSVSVKSTWGPRKPLREDVINILLVVFKPFLQRSFTQLYWQWVDYKTIELVFISFKYFTFFHMLMMIDSDLKQEERKAFLLKRKNGAGYCPFKCLKIILIIIIR